MEQDINLDDLNEDDIVKALEGFPDENLPMTCEDDKDETKPIPQKDGLVKLDNTTTNGDIVSLLKQLLNDKTLEISIRVKD
jgi:hypothetical protein